MATCGAGIPDAAAAVAAVLPTTTAAQPGAMSLRDAIYLYNPFDGRGDKILAGVDCDVFQLVMDVTSGHTNLAMGQSNTLANAIDTQTAYLDTIQYADAMFAYALYPGSTGEDLRVQRQNRTQFKQPNWNRCRVWLLLLNQPECPGISPGKR